jgi:hypothetical protein
VNGGRVVAAFAGALVALACTTPMNNNPPPPPTGNGGIGPGIGGMPMPPSGDVVVEIQEPMDGLVALAGTLVDVRVHAFVDSQTGTDFIEPSSVEALVRKRGESAILESTKLASQGMDIFTGRISLGDLPTGDYELTVNAVSSGGTRGSWTINFQLDAGPILIVTSPQPMQSYKGLLVVEVIASAGIFEPLDGPYATVANYPVALAPVGDPANHLYRGTIDLRDPMPPMILPRLVDEQLVTVWATNANGKRVERHIVFRIDEEGPAIVLTRPEPGEIVGDIMRISATVIDPAGVLDASVIAVIGDDTQPALFNIQLKPDGAGTYSSFFDTRKLTKCTDPPIRSEVCVVYPTISFRASDELGNERAISYNFTVDNIAPVADLDPPRLRSFRIEERFVCSHEFDPLGNGTHVGDMPNDMTRVAQVFDLRARIEDDGNHAVGLKVTPISLVDPDKTAVYVLDDTENHVLIVDTDGDGWCDAINPLLIPTTEPPVTNDQVLKIRLVPIEREGVANFTPDSTLPTNFCRSGLDPTLPQPLCIGNQPTIAIGYAGSEPAIWSLEDVDVNWCFGKPFDSFANNISQGWACIAVATTDFANNSSVSPPLRVDIDYDGLDDMNPPRPFGFNTPGRGTPPACTGTYDRVTNTVTPAPCRTREYERQTDNDYYCFGTECAGPPLPL